MKKIIIIIVLCLGLASLVFTGLTFMKMFPQKPTIKYGEFPFCLIYEIDGKTIEVKDTLICEYEGFAADAAQGFYRTWKSSLKSGKTRITLFQNQELEIFFTPNINHWEAGAFYMGDDEIYDEINIPFPNAWYTNDLESKRLNAYIISADEMLEKYKIKLLSWKINPPIKNTFN